MGWLATEVYTFQAKKKKKGHNVNNWAVSCEQLWQMAEQINWIQIVIVVGQTAEEW
jgi:hypothetical protein